MVYLEGEGGNLGGELRRAEVVGGLRRLRRGEASPKHAGARFEEPGKETTRQDCCPSDGGADEQRRPVSRGKEAAMSGTKNDTPITSREANRGLGRDGEVKDKRVRPGERRSRKESRRTQIWLRQELSNSRGKAAERTGERKRRPAG